MYRHKRRRWRIRAIYNMYKIWPFLTWLAYLDTFIILESSKFTYFSCFIEKIFNLMDTFFPHVNLASSTWFKFVCYLLAVYLFQILSHYPVNKKVFCPFRIDIVIKHKLSTLFIIIKHKLSTAFSHLKLTGLPHRI